MDPEAGEIASFVLEMWKMEKPQLTLLPMCCLIFIKMLKLKMIANILICVSHCVW